MADVDDAQAAAEPGDEHFVVVDLLGRLVRAPDAPALAR